MEFTKDIHFTNGLKGNETVGITYSGSLYKNGSESVSIVYGFGENWEHTTEKEMIKSETGFYGEIEIKENFDTFNFCFRNGTYEWDNNQSFNYISSISPATSPKINPTFDSLFEEDEIEAEFSTDFIMEILNGLLEENVNTSTQVNVETDKQQILDEILSENTTPAENAVYIEDFDMDELIDNILNPVINCSTSEIVGEEVTGGVEVEGTETSLGTVAAETSESVGVGVGIDNVENATSENTGLVPTPEDTYLVSPRKLRKFYLIQKKIKLAVYKLVVSIPKLLFGSFDEENN